MINGKNLGAPDAAKLPSDDRAETDVSEITEDVVEPVVDANTRLIVQTKIIPQARDILIEVKTGNSKQSDVAITRMVAHLHPNLVNPPEEQLIQARFQILCGRDAHNMYFKTS